jgi:hypothetical protein
MVGTAVCANGLELGICQMRHWERDVLQQLPIDLNVNISLLYPSPTEEKKLHMTSLALLFPRT